jgi:uncharacterized membrane protein
MSDGHPSTPSVRSADSEPRIPALPGKEIPATGEPLIPDFECEPLTRSEYISAMVHFYRGELERAGDWRARLDPTTNWAVVTTGAMLSFAFNTPDHSHVTVLLTVALVSIFLGFESRRYRYFDVWRSRVRMIEENFWIPMIRRNLVSPRSDWREQIAHDLDRPTFKLSYPEAIAVRMRYNYLWIFLAILVAWLAKLAIHPRPAVDLGTFIHRMAVGPLPGPVTLFLVVAFYAVSVGLAMWAGHTRRNVDEVRGLEEQLEHWKT